MDDVFIDDDEEDDEVDEVDEVDELSSSEDNFGFFEVLSGLVLSSTWLPSLLLRFMV